jgi:hypothetical protein
MAEIDFAQAQSDDRFTTREAAIRSMAQFFQLHPGIN